MRANRTYGSEGGEASPSRPLSNKKIGACQAPLTSGRGHREGVAGIDAPGAEALGEPAHALLR